MILIGQFDSPFVRRVAIAMRLYGIAFEHRPWSTFGDADKIAPFNPLRRVPTLVLDDGEALIESAMILDYLDDRRRPRQGDDRAERRDAAAAFADFALAMGLGDKGVSLLYERVLRKEKQLDLWVERCKSQISGVLDVLEKERAAVKTPYWSGEKHRPCRHRGRLRAALHRRGASRAVRRALSGAEGAFRAVRGAAAVQGDRAAARAAEGVRCCCCCRVGKAQRAHLYAERMVGTSLRSFAHPTAALARP